VIRESVGNREGNDQAFLGKREKQIAGKQLAPQ